MKSPKQRTIELAVLALFWLLVLVGRASDQRELGRRIEDRLKEGKGREANWGIEVRKLSSGCVLFATNEHRLFTPASNMKLVVVAAALNRLGADFRIKTSLQTGGRLRRGGELDGGLVVVGYGDPSFLDGRRGEDGTKMEQLVEEVRKLGIRRIRRGLGADESYFRGSNYGKGVAWEDLQTRYGAAAGVLNINDNYVELQIRGGERQGERAVVEDGIELSLFDIENRVRTVDSKEKASVTAERRPGEKLLTLKGTIPERGEAMVWVSVPDATQYFLESLRRALIRKGVRVDREKGQRKKDTMKSSNRRELVVHYSESLGELIKEVQKNSNNLHAQLLLLVMGAEADQNPNELEKGWPRAETTEESGIRVVNEFLAKAGVVTNEVRITEGAGLSRENYLSPAAIVQLLRYMDQHSGAEAWREALPVAGEEGTLKNRMREGLAVRNIRAKTGTLRNISACSGYGTNAAGERVAFSILVNGYPGTSREANLEIDRIVEEIIH